MFELENFWLKWTTNGQIWASATIRAQTKEGRIARYGGTFCIDPITTAASNVNFTLKDPTSGARSLPLDFGHRRDLAKQARDHIVETSIWQEAKDCDTAHRKGQVFRPTKPTI